MLTLFGDNIPIIKKFSVKCRNHIKYLIQPEI